MPIATKLIKSQFIKSISHGGTTVSIEWAQQTDAWKRTFCDPALQSEFAKVVEENKGQLPFGTTQVVMQ